MKYFISILINKVFIYFNGMLTGRNSRRLIARRFTSHRLTLFSAAERKRLIDGLRSDSPSLGFRQRRSSSSSSSSGIADGTRCLPMAPLKVLTRISASSRTFGCTSSCRSICILPTTACGGRYAAIAPHGPMFSYTTRMCHDKSPCHLETWQTAGYHWPNGR